MESLFRATLIAWLRDDPALVASLNAIEEESPVQASAPWLGIAASAGADWSVKGRKGREFRLALELVDRADEQSGTAEIVAVIESRIAAMMPDQDGFDLVSTQFLRSRAERRARGLRAVLLEYRFRIFEAVAA